MLKVSIHNKKYCTTGRMRGFRGITLWEIEDVRTGRIGGWIENECNLSFRDEAWIDTEAIVCGTGYVKDNAIVYGGIVDGGELSGAASMFGGKVSSGHICDYAIISEDEENTGYTIIEGGVIYGNAVVSGGRILSGFIGGDAKIWGGIVGGSAYIIGGEIYEGTIVKNNARVLSGTHNSNQVITSYAYKD